MCKIKSFLLFIVVGSNVFGQSISVETYAFPKREEKASMNSEMLKFPVIKTGNSQIEELINRDLLNRVTAEESPGLSIEQTLFEWSEGIDYMSYNVTYLKNNLISFNIFIEGCGAYCSSRIDYFTYDTDTGRYITIDQIIDISTRFKAQVVAERNKQYEMQKKQLVKRFKSKEPHLQEDSFRMAINCFKNCTASFDLESFSLREDSLEIIDDCSFPHAIRSLQPDIQLHYKYENIKEVLKVKL
jgi:hypothetical protein